MGFEAVDAALQRGIDAGHLAGVSYRVLHRGRPVAQACLGWADREAGIALGPDHLFRAYSNTKLVTSIAALQLLEQGRCGLDDPVGEYIPALRGLRVLAPGATGRDATEAAEGPVRLRHLLTHTAGFTYAFLQPQAAIGRAYVAAGMVDPAVPLADMVDRLGTLPLLFQPGTRWHYSVAIDVVGRLLEVLWGQPLDVVLRRQVFEPVGMRDTGFFVPEGQGHRLATLYVGDLQDPARPGLRRADHLPWAGAFLKPVARLNPGGGLVTSLDDWMRLLAALDGGGAPLLQPASMPLLRDNQLPPGLWIGFPDAPPQPGRGHSFAASVTVDPMPGDPALPGDVQWGGMAGTHWWLSPRAGIACALMTQRHMGYGLPFWAQFQRGVLDALGEGAAP